MSCSIMGVRQKTMAVPPFHHPRRRSSGGQADQQPARVAVRLPPILLLAARVRLRFGDLPKRIAAALLAVTVTFAFSPSAMAMTPSHGTGHCGDTMVSMDRAVPRKSTNSSLQLLVQRRPAPCCSMANCCRMARCSTAAFLPVTISAMNLPNPSDTRLWGLREFQPGITWQPDRPPPIG